MLDQFIIFGVSLFFLIKSSDMTVKEAIKMANALSISVLAIGFFLIAISTSLPELAISSISSTLKENEISLGNVIGSNIANILLIFGIASFITTIKINNKQLKQIRITLLLISLVSLVIWSFNGVSRFMGIALISIFAIFSFYFLKGEKRKIEKKLSLTQDQRLKNILFLFLSLSIVIVSSYFIVFSTKNIAAGLGLSKALIGTTIIAIGTSLPELSVSLAAMKRNNHSLLFGNIIGSCIVNMTFILGVAAIINPISISSIPNFMTLIVFLNCSNIVFLLLCKDKVAWVIDGVILLAFYMFFLLISSGLLVWKWI